MKCVLVRFRLIVGHAVFALERLHSFSSLLHPLQVFRARFSALTSWEIKHAYRNLGRLDIRQALAVDGQQEIDLKAGMAFSRYTVSQTCGRAGCGQPQP